MAATAPALACDGSSGCDAGCVAMVAGDGDREGVRGCGGGRCEDRCLRECLRSELVSTAVVAVRAGEAGDAGEAGEAGDVSFDR